MLFSPKNEQPHGVYDPSLAVTPAFKPGRNFSFWMLDFRQDKRSEPLDYSPSPVAKSAFEYLFPVTHNLVMQPVLLHIMNHLTQHDVDMVRAASRTLRASWPRRIMGKTAYCRMVFPNCNFNKLIARTRDQPEEPRTVCGSRNRQHVIIPCEGNELGLASHGSDHDI
jgi:hypothetical protein